MYHLLQISKYLFVHEGTVSPPRNQITRIGFARSKSRRNLISEGSDAPEPLRSSWDIHKSVPFLAFDVKYGLLAYYSMRLHVDP